MDLFTLLFKHVIGHSPLITINLSEFSVFPTIINLASAIGTVSAAIAAYYSAKASQKAAKETELTRKADFLPVLSLFVEATLPTELTIRVKNVGRDLARNSMISIPTVSQAVPSHFVKLGNIAKGGETESVITVPPIEQLLSLPEYRRKLQLLYWDIFGRQILTEALLVRETDAPNLRSDHIAIKAWQFRLPQEEIES